MLSNKDKVSYLLQITNGFIPMIIISLLARNGDLTFMGEYFLALSVIGASQILVDYGFNQTAVRSFATLLERGGDAADIWSLLISIVAAKFLIATVLTFFVIAYTVYAESVNTIFILTGCIIGIVLSVTNIAPLVFALKKSSGLSFVTFAARVIFLLPLFVAAPSLIVALMVTLVPMLIANIYSFVLAGSSIGVKMHEVKIDLNIREQFVEGRSTFFISLLASMVATAWPLILSYSLPRNELGVYGFADRIVRGLMSLVTPLQAFILASNRLVDIFAIPSHAKHMTYFSVIMFVLLVPVALMALPEQLYSLIFGEGVIEYRVVFAVYGFGFIFYLCNFVFYTQMIVARREILYAPIGIASLLMSILIAHFFEFYIYTPLIYEIFVASTLAFLAFKTKIN